MFRAIEFDTSKLMFYALYIGGIGVTRKQKEEKLTGEGSVVCDTYVTATCYKSVA